MRLLAIIILNLFLTISELFGQPDVGKSDFWVSAYLPSWELNIPGTTGNYGQLPIANIDWTAFTHVIMFAASANTNGTLSYGNLLPSRRKPFNIIARSNGRPVILAIGGAGGEGWGEACSPANINTFLKSVLAELDTSQYDGIDLDIEPFRNTGTINDTTRVGPFIRRLYDSLQVRRQYLDPTKKPLLTTAILPGWAGEWWAKHEHLFDQINIMTYDMAQSLGWGVDRTWHNNAIYGPQPPTGTNLYYTTIQTRWLDQMYKRGGKNRGKYGIGVDFNGTLYRGGTVLSDVTKGVHQPKQRWATTPTFTWDYDFDVMFATYLDTATAATKRYDTEAQAAYLSILSNDGNPANEVKLSYTDSTQIHRIIQYARDSSMGGVILWNIGEAYLPSKYPNRDRMLQFVKTAVLGTEILSAGEPVQTADISNYILLQNYPNPFNPTTKIQYQLPFESRVKLTVYNIVGQEIITLVNEVQTSGIKSISWDANNGWGQSVASGIYFYRIEISLISDPTKKFVQVKQMVILK